MKRKVLKTAAFLTAVVLISGLGAFANALVGNPVSRLLAKRTAQAYLDGHYGDTGFVLEEVSYSFKEGGYYATIRSPAAATSISPSPWTWRAICCGTTTRAWWPAAKIRPAGSVRITAR